MIHIKDVARQTNITVRTLRYYDQIGLLTASAKTEGGHRLYSKEEIEKLQFIQFFKRIGYKLQDIGLILANPDWDWKQSLKSQLAYIAQERTELQQMENAIKELINGIVVEDGDNWLAIQKLIQLSNNHNRSKLPIPSESLSQDDMLLWEKLPKMRGEDPDSLEWIGLLGQIKRAITSDPASPQVQRIIRRMLEKQAEQFQDEETFLDDLWEIRKSPEQSEQYGFYPLDATIITFLEKAYEIYLSNLRH